MVVPVPKRKRGLVRALLEGPALKIASVYATFGALWILASDKVLAALVPDVDRLTALQTYKGWLYVGVTAVLVFVLVWVYFQRRLLLQHRLQKEEEAFRRYIEELPVGVFRAAPGGEGRFLLVNPAAASLFGCASVEELLRIPPAELFETAEDRARLIRKLKEEGQIAAERVRLKRRDGTTIWAALTARMVDEEVTGTQYADGIVVDETERVHLEEMMIQSEKMLSVGGLAAGMAHEINNPLGGILQNAQVMQNRLSPQQEQSQRAAEACGTTMETIEAFMKERGLFHMLDLVLDSGRRATQIVDNMLSFSRRSESSRAVNDLRDVLDSTVKLAENDYDLKKQYDFRRIEIERDYAENVPEVPCERSELQQVFLNILQNGAHAMSQTPPNREGKPRRARFVLRIHRDGHMVRVEIEDNGPGMDEDVRKRVFEPFFTTKEVGVGTGLGLSLSYFIITEHHDGAMSVDATPGHGARFTILLPLDKDLPRGG